MPIAPKYQRAGTIGCNPLESFGLRESAASPRKACRGGGPSPILPVHNGLQRRAGMRKIPHGALMALATAVGVLLFVQGRLLAIPTDERKADREAISKVLSEQQSAWNRGDVEAFLVGYWRSPELEFRFLGPEAALVLGRWHLKREKDDLGGVFTLVWQRFPDGWKIIHDHTSTVAPQKTSP